ncbi:MAG: hypothetical protein OXD43_03975 [Bacteroidetes bacterium]|nr:hypothetical protein [Bacteroidota bacterium]
MLRRSSYDSDGVGLWGTDQLPVYLEENITSGSSSFESTIILDPVIGNRLAKTLAFNWRLPNLALHEELRQYRSTPHCT